MRRKRLKKFSILTLCSTIMLQLLSTLSVQQSFAAEPERADPNSHLIFTVAGMYHQLGYNGDNQPAIEAKLSDPVGVTASTYGIYIADRGNNRIRKVDQDGLITTVASSLNQPSGVAMDSEGNLYIADGWNNRVLKRTATPPNSIITVAGDGSAAFGGDDGPATSAQLDSPNGIVLDSEGNLYIADTNNHRIRKVDLTGKITTVAGNGDSGYNGDNQPATGASLNFPMDVAVDSAGNLYIADMDNHRVRKVDTHGQITTVAGNGHNGSGGENGPAIEARVNPYGVALDQAGNLYIADPTSDKILKVDSEGILTSVAGGGISSGNEEVYDFSAKKAHLSNPFGLTVDSSGKTLYFAEYDTKLIRKVRLRPDAPNVSVNDVANTITGINDRMEYFVNPGSGSVDVSYLTEWTTYDPLNPPDLSEEKTVFVRLKEDTATDTLASFPAKLLFHRAPPQPGAPNVTSNDMLNLIMGTEFYTDYLGQTLEYSTDDGETWTAYDKANPQTFDGAQTVQVRIAEDPVTGAPAGLAKTIWFTPNPPPPAAPTNFSVDDTENVIEMSGSGLTKYEYSTDAGGTWTPYEQWSYPRPTFSGNQTVLVRVVADPTTGTPPGLTTALTFTENPEAPDVTANDDTNLLEGADDTMEYSTNNGNTWRLYNSANPPIFNGFVYVMVRVAAANGVPAGASKGVSFSEPPAAPNVTANDETNMIVGANGSMEYSTDGGETWTFYDEWDPPTFSGTQTVQVRVWPDGAVKTLYFTPENGGGSATVPDAPTGVAAVAGNGQATVSFTPPLSDGGSPITGYKVISQPGGLMATGTTSPITITGLTNGTAYTFKVVAANSVGDSPESAASTSVTPTAPIGSPGSPTNVTAVAGNGQATISFTPPANDGGNPITGYIITSQPEGLTATGTTSPITVTGLTNGTAYTFTVVAVNGVGNSPQSAPSASVTPLAPPDAPTGVTAVAGNGEATVSFTPPANNGGSAITGYKVISEPGGITATGTTGPITVTGLTNDTPYTFKVVATNSVGDSPESTPSTSVTPTAPAGSPAAPTNVAAAAGNGQATISFTPPVDDGGNPITGYIVTSQPGGLTATGAASPITITGLTNGTSYTFTVKAINAAGSSAASTASSAVVPSAPTGGNGGNSGGDSGGNGGAGGGTTSSGSSNEEAVIVLVNGKEESAGTATTGKRNDQTLLTIAVDQKKLDDKLAAEGQGAVVTIPVKTKSDVIIGELNGQMIKNMENKEAVLVLQTDNATYTIPAHEINIDAIFSQLGQPTNLADIKVRIEISASAAETVKLAENAAEKGTFSLVMPPLEFNITAVYGSQTATVTKFNAYVERTVAIPDGIDPNKITTGVVIEADGSVRHVPTQVTKNGARYFAKINSLTNSTYAVVWNPIEFSDVAKHWAKSAVNDMGSRMVIDGTGGGKFTPNRDITRAEFAAILVRGLGLKPENGPTAFSDVKASDWYSGVINTAYAYQLIDGFQDGTFRPQDKITREQAMLILSKAMVLTGLADTLSAKSADAVLHPFGDAAKVAKWAQNGVSSSVDAGIVTGRSADTLAPKANMTRAEVAAIVQRLLQKSELIEMK